MRAGEAAQSAGVSVKALRFYEDSGLLRPVRLSNGYRECSETDVRLASEIRMLMSLGVTTQQTRPFLECLRAGHGVGDDCPESLAAYQHKIDELDRLIARLTGARHRLVDQMRTATARGFRDNLTALREHGAERVLALSSDDARYQQDLVRRLRLPYPMLSDPQLRLAQALDLPTFQAHGWTPYKRLTLILDGLTIEHVFYPIFPPDAHAGEVLDWLRAHPRSNPQTGE